MMENTNNNAGKWVLALVVIAGVAGGYFYLQNQSGNTATTEAPAITSHMIQGTVTAVDAAKLQITIQTSSTSPAKIVTVSPTTKIQKIISQLDASGKTEKQAAAAVDISGVQKGTVVTVLYQTDVGDVLGGVTAINFSVVGDVDAYLKTQITTQPSGQPQTAQSGAISPSPSASTSAPTSPPPPHP